MCTSLSRSTPRLCPSGANTPITRNRTPAMVTCWPTGSRSPNSVAGHASRRAPRPGGWCRRRCGSGSCPRASVADEHLRGGLQHAQHAGEASAPCRPGRSRRRLTRGGDPVAVADDPGHRVHVGEPQPGHRRRGAELDLAGHDDAAGSSRAPRPAARPAAWCRCRSRPGRPRRATPMTTPSMVSPLRSRLARSASSATRQASPSLIDGLRRPRRHVRIGTTTPSRIVDLRGAPGPPPRGRG